MSKQEYQKQDAAEIIAGVWDVVAGMVGSCIPARISHVVDWPSLTSEACLIGVTTSLNSRLLSCFLFRKTWITRAQL